jgi:hypothetical protein
MQQEKTTSLKLAPPPLPGAGNTPAPGSGTQPKRSVPPPPAPSKRPAPPPPAVSITEVSAVALDPLATAPVPTSVAAAPVTVPMHTKRTPPPLPGAQAPATMHGVALQPAAPSMAPAAPSTPRSRTLMVPRHFDQVIKEIPREILDALFTQIADRFADQIVTNNKELIETREELGRLKAMSELVDGNLRTALDELRQEKADKNARIVERAGLVNRSEELLTELKRIEAGKADHEARLAAEAERDALKEQIRAARTQPAARRAVQAQPAAVASKSDHTGPIVIILLVVLAALGAAGYWWLVGSKTPRANSLGPAPITSMGTPVAETAPALNQNGAGPAKNGKDRTDTVPATTGQTAATGAAPTPAPPAPPAPVPSAPEASGADAPKECPGTQIKAIPSPDLLQGNDPGPYRYTSRNDGSKWACASSAGSWTKGSIALRLCDCTMTAPPPPPPPAETPETTEGTSAP